MADKRVQIGVPVNEEEGLPALSLAFLRVTELSIEEELDSDIVKTFDEPVTVPSNDGGYSIDISALEARNVDDFITLKKIIKRMKTETGAISVFETIKHKDGNFEVENHLTGVSLTSNKVDYSAEDLTARDLSFNAEANREIVANEEIK